MQVSIVLQLLSSRAKAIDYRTTGSRVRGEAHDIQKVRALLCGSPVHSGLEFHGHESCGLSDENIDVGRSIRYQRHERVAAFIDDYVARRGMSGKWSSKTQVQRKADFRPLREIAIRDNLQCRHMNAMHLRECLRCAGTAGRGTSLRGLLRTMLVFGRHAGYFTRDQAELIDAVTWTPPVGYVRPRSRRDQAKLHVHIATGGEVMTHDQVKLWAKACQKHWVHGFAFIHACALLGLRSGKVRPLTASAEVAFSGSGNLVDLDNHVVRIRWQATTEGEAKHLPKNNKLRDVTIPQAAPAGFRLDRWLAHRVPVALAEQARGQNPLALIFPNPSGGLFGEQNLRNRVWAPAAETLGWAMEEYVTALGKKRRLFRFTLHALRDRYANTAIHEWKYPEDVLLQQGSWEDSETVRRFYSGVTDESQSIAMRIHGWSESIARIAVGTRRSSSRPE